MDETVLATDVERKFSSILRGVREGKSYVVISHGRPVARTVPADRREGVFRRSRAALLSRLEGQPVVDAGNWIRDDAYDEG
ncbi:MAG: type II toxin-antitoxin system prevent-host-death family antitoxin [Mesorhizobium sp.]|uniref:type II toxin-antitoxin system Phd/YefM family antitoxin n=1 Tax=Mesorhizobium sp. TaxID=1871066 RepID=UPI00120FCB76|nr:type II toxin-antitoxin system prevent-host-death family antitoxin [Mesorhizobium sp.]TIO74435.1 MAG: type II toxin-antitoxin system prevent-host-death family antitoxin [Mesorhizobium sp.]TIO83767.1 MAG: type II toxin-antitoxin system prevent-host-death family antitoxin [Mesorhizobium sp.]